MRLAIIQNLYSNYINNFQTQYASKLTSYNESLSLLQGDSFSWNGCWGEELKPYGIEVVEMYVNFDVLNKHWCKENGFSEKTPILDILIEQLKAFKIDVVLNTDVNILRSPFIKRIKDDTQINYVYAHICSPYFSYFDITEYDGIFTCVHRFVDLFKGYGKPAVYMPHCFNPKIIDKVKQNKSDNKINRIFFAGGVLRGAELHNERERLLLGFIEDKIPLSFFSEIADYNYVKGTITVTGKKGIYYIIKALRALKVKDSFINRIPLIKEGLPWEFLPGDTANRTLYRAASKPLYGLEFFSEMQNHTVSLNIHAGVTKDEAANMRLFESTGMGTALLTDYKSNLSDFFDIENELVTFRSIDEAKEKAMYLLNNPDVSARIGAAGQQRILKDHTFKNRAPVLSSNILQNFK